MTTLQQLVELRKALENALKAEHATSERLMDILQAIHAFPVTAGMIKDSKLGKTLQTVRTKYSAAAQAMPDVCNLSRDIMVAWKQKVEEHMQQEKKGATPASGKPAHTAETAPSSSSAPASSSSSSSSSSTTTTTAAAAAPSNGTNGTSASSAPVPAAAPSSSSSSSSSSSRNGSTPAGDAAAAVAAAVAPAFASYPDGRQKVVRLLADQLKLSTSDDARAMAVALAVDMAIDQLPQHSFNYDNKSYMGKARSFVFNMKRNESLRADLLSGALTPALLVTLTPADLAADDVRKARQVMAAADMESRRTDWVEEHREKIQESIGLDPTNVWQYDEDDESVDSIG